MAAPNTLRRSEMNVECITMAVGFLLRNRRFVPEVGCQFSHTMTTAQSRGAPANRMSQGHAAVNSRTPTNAQSRVGAVPAESRSDPRDVAGQHARGASVPPTSTSGSPAKSIAGGEATRKEKSDDDVAARVGPVHAAYGRVSGRRSLSTFQCAATAERSDASHRRSASVIVSRQSVSSFTRRARSRRASTAASFAAASRSR